MSALSEEICKIQKLFEVTPETLQKGVALFIEAAEAGLESNEDKFGMPMIPAYVTNVPSGKEKGVLLAADLGGTNFRVCSVELNGNHGFKLNQSKSRIPDDLMAGSSGDELFRYLAEKIALFIAEHHQTSLDQDSQTEFELGFTFSFPVSQTSLRSGTLLRWTKGFNIPDVVGEDVVDLLQKHLDLKQVPVRVQALANDTVGTLLSRAYSAGAVAGGQQGETLIGAIFGTGTNGAYPEKLSNIKKLPKHIYEELVSSGAKYMVINTEWGSFDNRLEVLPNTEYDKAIDESTGNRGFHLFEKRVSGMFLGEILRRIMVDFYEKGLLFQKYVRLPHRLTTPWALDSAILSVLEIDDSTELIASEVSLRQSLRLETTAEERYAVQQLTRAVSKRAAYLSAIPLAGIIIKTEALKGVHKEVDIGVDGSVVEFYPGFRAMIRDALAMTQLRNRGERRIHINIAKDGSGVGAALCALRKI